MAAEAGFLPPVGVSCADMKFGMVTVSDGKTKPQPVRECKVCFLIFSPPSSARFAQQRCRLFMISGRFGHSGFRSLQCKADPWLIPHLLSICQVRLQLTPDAFILQREELCFGGVPGAPLEGATGSDFSIHDTLNSDGDSRFSDQQVSSFQRICKILSESWLWLLLLLLLTIQH